MADVLPTVDVGNVNPAGRVRFAKPVTWAITQLYSPLVVLSEAVGVIVNELETPACETFSADIVIKSQLLPAVPEPATRPSEPLLPVLAPTPTEPAAESFQRYFPPPCQESDPVASVPYVVAVDPAAIVPPLCTVSRLDPLPTAPLPPSVPPLAMVTAPLPRELVLIFRADNAGRDRHAARKTA